MEARFLQGKLSLFNIYLKPKNAWKLYSKIIIISFYKSKLILNEILKWKLEINPHHS